MIYRLDRLKREELSLFWDASWKNYDLHCRIKTPEIGWSISYNSVNQFWLNLSHQNSKNKSTSNVKKFHILWNIFSHFNISHNRRNTRYLVDLRNCKKKNPILFFYMFQSCNQNEKWYEAAPLLHTTMHTAWIVNWKLRILGLKAFYEIFAVPSHGFDI